MHNLPAAGLASRFKDAAQVFIGDGLVSEMPDGPAGQKRLVRIHA
jgi:hypothetical protein